MANHNIFSNAHLLPGGSLFGTDGIRGEAGTFLTAPLAMEVGYWAGKFWSGQGTVIIGQDSRNSGDMLANAIAAGLNAAGLNVWRLGLCPTPCVSYLARKTEAIGGIMISASHNPPGDNGIKLFDSDGTKVLKDKTQTIEDALRGNSPFSPEPRPWGKHYDRADLVLSYEKFLQQSLPTTTNFIGLKIVLDLAWGAATQVAPELFNALGAELVVLHGLPDGDRINVNCGSTHLDQLKHTVVKEKAHIGFAFDGDADRVLAVDDQGRMVDGDHLLYLWGQALMAQHQLPDNLIVGTVMANLGFEKAWQRLGGKFMRTPVGDQHVQAAMWATGATLGGEQSGHVICHHLSVSGDGIQTALQFTDLLQRSQQPLSTLVDQAFSTYPQVLANIRVEERELRLNWEQSAPLTTAIEEATKALGDRGRVLVRASGTEPLIRVMVEAEDQQLVNHWTSYLVQAVETYRDQPS